MAFRNSGRPQKSIVTVYPNGTTVVKPLRSRPRSRSGWY